jgi:hypothetical protein
MTTMDPQLAPLSVPTTPSGMPPEPDQPVPQPTLLRWGDTAVGAAITAEETAADLVAGLRGAVARRGERVARLADRGATERARWQQRAERTAEAALATITTSPVIDRVVDHQLQRVLRPVVRAVLDDVLLMLENEPERMQILIRGQRETMVDELVGRLRTSAAVGDTAVDRLTFRVFHRGPRPEPGPPPELRAARHRGSTPDR